MRARIRILALAAATALAAPAAGAQAKAATAPPTDARWLAWLGCWTADTAGAAASTVTCVVPVVRSRGVDLLTISRGEVVAREHVDADGRPQPMTGNGCRGTETANWSADGHRVYSHADFTCGETDAPSVATATFAILSSGDWLRVEKTHSGGGTAISAIRLHPTPLTAAVPAAAARTIEGQQRAISAARAAAAAPITPDAIVDAVHNLDGDVVRTWLVATAQAFDFDAAQIAALADAGVPSPILRLLGPALVEAPAPTRASEPVYVEEQRPEMTTLRRCPQSGCTGVNRYSDYNGTSWGTTYPYGYWPYGYTPFVPYFYYGAPVVVHRQPATGRDRPHASPPPRASEPRGRDGNPPPKGMEPRGRSANPPPKAVEPRRRTP